jgi:hypothetical protein
MSTTNDSASITKVTLRVDSTQRRTEQDTLFKVTWSVEDKNGKSGNIFIIFSVSPVQRPNLIGYFSPRLQPYGFLF